MQDQRTDLEGRGETEILVDLSTGEATPCDPDYFRGVGTPTGTALLSEVSKLDLLEILQRALDA